MKRLLATLPALTFALFLAAPAQALDLNNMSEDERSAFHEEIRAYLMENPQVIMEAVAVLEQRKAEAQAQDDTTLVQVNAEALFNDTNSWAGGNLSGDITVVEFLDYRCGYCRKAHDEVSALIENDGNIKFIIKEFPILGPASEAASRFAIATRAVAGDAAYKTLHDTLMTFKGEFDDASLRRISHTLGLDADPILAEMNSETTSKIINDNRALAGRMQISGTPTFVMGNQMIRGYVPLDGMLQIVGELRK